MIQGREGVRGYYEGARPVSVDVRSLKTEAVGSDLILDIGTFTATLAKGAGGGTLEGEYVVLAQQGEYGLQIRSFTAFPIRQAPEAQVQQ